MLFVAVAVAVAIIVTVVISGVVEQEVGVVGSATASPTSGNSSEHKGTKEWIEMGTVSGDFMLLLLCTGVN